MAGPKKADDALKTISEVSELFGIPQHILRYWETRFPQLRPLQRAGNRRYYRPDDVSLVREIQHHLEAEGYTIKGVQRHLAKRKRPSPSAKPSDSASPPPLLAALETEPLPTSVAFALREIRNDLAAALRNDHS